MASLFRLSRRPRLPLFAALILLALFVSACTGRAAATSWPGFTLVGDTIYMAYGEQVHALDAATGAERWAYPTETKNSLTFFAEPAVDGSLLVAGSYNKSVYGLNDQDGTPLWSAPFAESTDHIVGRALVSGDKVYVPSADYSVYALSAKTGEKLWSFKAQQSIWASPVMADGNLVIASLDHDLYALNPATGSLVWTRELGGAIAGTPAVADGLLIVGTFDNNLYGVQASDGQVKWAEPTQGWVWSGPLETDGTLYFGDLAGYLYSAATQTGKINWQVKPGGALRGTPALADGVLYAPARDGYLYFRSATDGSVVGPSEVELGGQLLSAPVVSGDLVIVGSYGAKGNTLLFAVNRATGAIAWIFPKAS
jgi:outer membrane protein assembly factor BamB